MEDEEENSVEAKASKLLELIDGIKIREYNKRNVNEMLYTLCEAGVIDGSYDADFAEIFYKVFSVSSILTDEEIKSIRL